ncbi:XRE family transcriptional regulator [Salibacterium salarium]|uniref:XRE family transcriptional regulator n=1 Tax=Salibacterium salarium TaxID=284579 RepID=A0A3R9QMF6_9BACI|nr:helix-turn-helix transcriptional regulator [Salibacterium salarium]RSL29078.1 XRE family transcriptional regulator [Salibacterium salarium]
MYKVGKCRLKEHIASANMTQADLARRTGYFRSNISEWASSDHVMTLEAAKNISEILECSIDELYEWDLR